MSEPGCKAVPHCVACLHPDRPCTCSRPDALITVELSKAAVDLLELRFPDVQEKFDVDVVRTGRQRRPFDVAGSRASLLALSDRYAEIYLDILCRPFEFSTLIDPDGKKFEASQHAIRRIRLALEPQGAKP